MQCINVCTSDKWLSPQEKESMKQAGDRGSWPQTLCTFLLSGFSLWFLLWPLSPICLTGMCHGSKNPMTLFSHLNLISPHLNSGRLNCLLIMKNGSGLFLHIDNKLRMKLWPINRCKACMFAYTAADDADSALPPCKCNMINGVTVELRQSREKKSFKDGEKNRQHVHYTTPHRFM